jgi:GTP-binding protein EngB required for normal cell division
MQESAPSPCVFVVGDYNTGKSTLLNALLRQEVLHTSREEGRAFPTFLCRISENHDRFAAVSAKDGSLLPKTHDEFLRLRKEEEQLPAFRALAAGCVHAPFNNLILVDTAGMSTDACESLEIADLKDQEDGLVLVVTDIEYWAAKHTMDFIAFHQEQFGDSIMVVANKADHLNAQEIERIHQKAAQRMEEYGINPAPRFFTLSARLEQFRLEPKNEYRCRTKARVRELCDSGFDALRVALYEFEAARGRRLPRPALDEVVSTPLAASFLASHEGVQV